MKTVSDIDSFLNSENNIMFSNSHLDDLWLCLNIAPVDIFGEDFFFWLIIQRQIGHGYQLA